MYKILGEDTLGINVSVDLMAGICHMPDVGDFVYWSSTEMDIIVVSCHSRQILPINAIGIQNYLVCCWR